MTLVVNREAWFHRDPNSGGVTWFDQLFNFGGDPGTVLELPGIGVRLQYDSGTVAMFSGHTHIHGVSESTHERLCLASYVRPSVQRLFRMHTPEAPSIESSMMHNTWRQYIQDILKWADGA